MPTGPTILRGRIGGSDSECAASGYEYLSILESTLSM